MVPGISELPPVDYSGWRTDVQYGCVVTGHGRFAFDGVEMKLRAVDFVIEFLVHALYLV